MQWPWVLRYTIGTRTAGGYRVLALLTGVGTDDVPTYQVWKVEPL